MRKILTSFAFIAASLTFAQVGVNNEDPQATLHIDAKEKAGVSTARDGILIPRVDRARAENMANVEESTLIYIDDENAGNKTGQAANIDEKGFYYFKGGVWVKLGGGAAAPGTTQNWEDIRYNQTDGKFEMTASYQQVPKNAWLVIGQSNHNFLKLPELQASDAGKMIVVYKKDPGNLEVQDHKGLTQGQAGTLMDCISSVRSSRGRTFVWTGENWITTNY